MKTNAATAAEPARVRATPYRTSNGALCPLCEKPVRLLSFSEAADFLKTDVREIESLAENRKLHRIHNNRGRVMICAESLFSLFENRPTQFLTLDELPGNRSKA